MGYDWVESSAGINIIQLENPYIGRRQVTMVQWVALQPLFEVYEEYKGFKGGGRRRKAWLRQEATEKELRDALEGISREAKRRR